MTLTPQLLADLYADVLIETHPTAVPAPEPAPVSFLGKNEKRILIIVSVSDFPYLPDGALTFLTSVLAACKLGLADVAIVNWQNRGERTGPELVKELQSHEVLLFGVPPLAFGLPMNFPHFQIQKFGANVFLSAPDLGIIEGDKAVKTALWKSLKTLFCL